jgi:hypothetical protein
MSDELESLRRQLETHQKNLGFLKEQSASYGPFDIPLRLLNQIDYERSRIAELEHALARIEVEEPLPPKPSVKIDENTISRNGTLMCSLSWD